MPTAPPLRTPDFRLYHSNALDVLARLLAHELRTPAPGQPLLAPEVVLVPQVAMRRWLQATLAQEHGIAANLEFLTPGEFVRRALDANVAGAAEDLDAQALRWRLYAALRDPKRLRLPALQALRGYLGDADAATADPLKPWSLAGELAGVFEKYQAWRRDWLLDWEAGQAPRDPQATLWREVAGGRRHRARRIDDYLRGFAGDHSPPPAGLPARLFAFATLNVSPDVLRVIATQARAGTLHFYLPTPTRAYWGDLQTLAERLRAGGDPFAGVEENPLLQAWGAAGRDFVAVLGSYEVVHPAGEIAAYAEPLPRAGDALADSLLKRLQRDLFHRRATTAAPLRAQVDRDDPTLQVHACHTRLREVQVLHDQLRGLLEDPRFDPPLQPREIAVLAPDIDPYAAHVAAVFGARAGHADFIPHALADASPLAGEPLADVFLRLLALPVSRFGLHEILDLVASPPIAAGNGLDAAALERLSDWLEAAGARWAIDAPHRAAHGAPADGAFTWRFALDRLLLGHASGDAADIALPGGGVLAPWPGLEGSALGALDVLLRLLRVLERHARTLAEALPPAQWRERLLALLEAVLPTAPDDGATVRTLERLRQLLDAFAESARQAGVESPVPAEVVRAHFAAALAEADTRAPLLTGGVSFGRMVPMRLLPFRVICVLGLNDGDYPRRDPAGGLNRLVAELGGAARRHGDRSLRDDDRFLFLQLFAAASDVLYLSYLGRDARDGSAREPSMLVTELLEAAAAQHADAASARGQLVVQHPLQPFAPAAFGGGDARRYSYRAEWHPAAGHAGAVRRPLGPWCDAPLPRDADALTQELTLDELRRFLRDPAKAFLRERLAMRLPEDVATVEDIEPLLPAAGGLDGYALNQAVLHAALSVDGDGLAARLRARGLLPSGPIAAAHLDVLATQARQYAALFTAWRDEAEESSLAIDLSFDLDLGDVRLHGQVAGVYPHGVARLRVGTPNGPSVIRNGLDWLALNASGHRLPLVGFHDTDDGPARIEQPGLDADTARAALRALLDLRAQGLTEPLPWGAYAGWCFFAARDAEAGFDAARKRWEGQNGSWGEGRGDAFALTLRGREVFADAALTQRFADISRAVFVPLTQGHPHDGADAAEAAA
ncbi:MAG TPA: exodeoxyribonuclease V subunit gamma [Luteimonas sp.]|nr:exodeoxyribonuclease V subunit gamma [Luteimonas sp.]